jgi:hypothetical protein
MFSQARTGAVVGPRPNLVLAVKGQLFAKEIGRAAERASICLESEPQGPAA